jgi:hypothetical protein
MGKFFNDFFNEACRLFCSFFLRCLIRESHNPVVAWSVFRPQDGSIALLRTRKADVHDMGETHRGDAAYFGWSRVCSIRQ